MSLAASIVEPARCEELHENAAQQRFPVCCRNSLTLVLTLARTYCFDRPWRVSASASWIASPDRSNVTCLIVPVKLNVVR
jgi:hypothetical protein